MACSGSSKKKKEEKVQPLQCGQLELAARIHEFSAFVPTCQVTSPATCGRPQRALGQQSLVPSSGVTGVSDLQQAFHWQRPRGLRRDA